MPFKSQAQIRKFRQMEERGEIKRGTTESMLRETSDPSLLPDKASRPDTARNKAAELRKQNDSGYR